MGRLTERWRIGQEMLQATGVTFDRRSLMNGVVGHIWQNGQKGIKVEIR